MSVLLPYDVNNNPSSLTYQMVENNVLMFLKEVEN